MSVFFLIYSSLIIATILSMIANRSSFNDEKSKKKGEETFNRYFK